VSDLFRALAGGADRFVIIDTETTGVYDGDRIVEIAMVTVDLDGNVGEVWDTLVNPLRDVSASHIHGITASMVANAPTFEMVAGAVAVRLHGACVVAHNLMFDVRMLANEFQRCGGELVVSRGIDTYTESGCRLSQACATFGIDLTGAHQARTDALATAQLFLKLAETCDRGGPATAPLGFHRAGRVRRREDTAPVTLPEPPLIASVASQLPTDRLEVRQRQYLEMVGRAVADLHLDVSERAALAGFAVALHLSPAEVAQAHRRYVNELIDAVIDDDQVTDDEYDMVVRIASALGVDQESVEARAVPYRVVHVTTVLQRGVQVVFTGDHPQFLRDELKACAVSLGLVTAGAVSRTTGLVAAADVASTSGKALKARRYGIPIVSVDEFVRGRLGDTLSGLSTHPGGLKVVTCRDCLVTWTLPATSNANTTKRCEDCASLAAIRPTKPRNAKAGIVDVWAPPTIEWLTCRACAVVWPREVVRGRKPHLCNTCSPVSTPPAPY
jgi:DNA polymerase-3 subunit epsilon